MHLCKGTSLNLDGLQKLFISYYKLYEVICGANFIPYDEILLETIKLYIGIRYK